MGICYDPEGCCQFQNQLRRSDRKLLEMDIQADKFEEDRITYWVILWGVNKQGHQNQRHRLDRNRQEQQYRRNSKIVWGCDRSADRGPQQRRSYQYDHVVGWTEPVHIRIDYPECAREPNHRQERFLQTKPHDDWKQSTPKLEHPPQTRNWGDLAA